MPYFSQLNYSRASGIPFDLLFDDKVVEGFADEKIGPCQGDIGQG